MSPKLKYSIKVSLSITLAFLIPFSQGWAQVQTAAITIVLIAAIGSLNDSILKGAMRVLGTLIGAVIGLLLIALFPQDRFLYLLSLSLCVSVFLYLVRAYKGDPSIFMLSAMTMMMMFDNGSVENVFLFGVDKIYMSIFGITIYTLVGVFIWPDNPQDTGIKNAQELSLLQEKIFHSKSTDANSFDSLLHSIIKQEHILENSFVDINSLSSDSNEWKAIILNYKKINKLLAIKANSLKEYIRYEDEISLLFKDISASLSTQDALSIPKAMQVDYELQDYKDLSHLQRASKLSEIANLQKLHTELCSLAQNFNYLHSDIPHFSLEVVKTPSNFIWGDIEDIKATLITFLIFWTATFIWIYFNPPAGFMIVTLATGLSVLTTYSPLKPSILITVFTFSFSFAMLMYVFVLPNLHLAWELSLFSFLYSFIFFYFLPGQLSVLFLIGLFLLNITNEMQYNFNVFVLMLLMFYIFLIILQVFYYIPFSTKAEYLFLKLKNRFFNFSSFLFERSNTLLLDKSTLSIQMLAWYSNAHLTNTHLKMKLWASKINLKHFNTLDKDTLDAFIDESEKFAYFLNLLYHQNLKIKNNSLINDLRKKDKLSLAKMSDTALDADRLTANLSTALEDVNFASYTKESLSEFYENISLRKDVWQSYFRCQDLLNKLDLQALKETRF